MIFLTSTAEEKVKETQIDCFADKSVTVIFGRWINSSDGSPQVDAEGPAGDTRDCFEPRRAAGM